MKYMHFNSSCSYAAIANLLYLKGINTEDSVIAKTINLPYILLKDGGTYLAGPMLQSKEIFDIYLNSIGYEFVEEKCTKDDVIKTLKESDENYMLGVNISKGNKHAIIFLEYKDNVFNFINNKYEESNEPDRFTWSAEELKERLDEETHLAHIEKTSAKQLDLKGILLASIKNLNSLKEDINNFSKKEITQLELRESMNTLFRAAILDSIAMFELLGEDALLERTKSIQKEFISVIKEDKENLKLEEEMDISGLADVLDEWKRLMKKNFE
nr:hypothetical protein [Ezakiella coagulans]